MALQSLRNNTESIFVSRSAQHLLITVLSNDYVMVSQVFVDILLGATSSLILDSVSTILLHPSIHITIDDEQCKQLIVNAQQQHNIAYNYARLIARCWFVQFCSYLFIFLVII
jgi:large-conductance mechanosensitive channel